MPEDKRITQFKMFQRNKTPDRPATERIKQNMRSPQARVVQNAIQRTPEHTMTPPTPNEPLHYSTFLALYHRVSSSMRMATPMRSVATALIFERTDVGIRPSVDNMRRLLSLVPAAFTVFWDGEQIYIRDNKMDLSEVCETLRQALVTEEGKHGAGYDPRLIERATMPSNPRTRARQLLLNDFSGEVNETPFAVIRPSHTREAAFQRGRPANHPPPAVLHPVRAIKKALPGLLDGRMTVELAELASEVASVVGCRIPIALHVLEDILPGVPGLSCTKEDGDPLSTPRAAEVVVEDAEAARAALLDGV